MVGDVTPPQVSPTLLGSSADTSAPADRKKTSPALLAGIAVAVLAVVALGVFVSTRGNGRRGRRVHTPAAVVDRNGDVVVGAGAAGAAPTPATSRQLRARRQPPPRPPRS